MAIKIKQSQNSSNSYYQLDDRALSNGTDTGSKSKNKDNSGLFRKMTKYSHNILKSAKNLTFDIVGAQVPNLKDIKEQITEVAAETTEESRKTLGEIVEFGKKKLGSGKSIKDQTKELLKQQKDDIVNRLKTGKIYMSDAEKASAQAEAEFGFSDFGDDFNFGDMSDTYVTSSEDDTLPDEPFSAPVRKGTVHYTNVSAKRRQQLSKSNVNRNKKKSSSIVSSLKTGELRLGDELVSNTTSQVGQSLMTQNEELWARSFAAEESRFGKLIGYQSTIVSSLNSIVEFNTNVVGENIKAQMEYQAKSMAAQEDMLALTKELKDTLIAVGTYKPTTYDNKNLLNGNRLNASEYSKVIKSNIGDLLSSKGFGGIGMMMGMIPMLADNGDMIKGSIDPLNSLLKLAGNSLLSTKTRAKAFEFNRRLENFGASFLNRMNELSEYGGNVGKIIGTILGDRSTKVNQTNMGLKDPNAVVGWTSKSDMTLNHVIPMYLAKILAATSGSKDEIYWDYKAGTQITSSSIQKEIEAQRKMAYSNETIRKTTKAMIDTSTNAKFNKNDKDQRNGIENALEKINQNIVSSKMPVNLARLTGHDEVSKKYRKQLTLGVDPKYANLALAIYAEGYSKMTTTEREDLNGRGYGSASRNVQKNLNRISEDAINRGTATVLAEYSKKFEAEEIARSILTDKKYNTNTASKNEFTDRAKTVRAFAKAEEIIKLASLLGNIENPEQLKAVEQLLKAEGVSNVDELMKKAVKLKEDATVKNYEQKLYSQALSMSIPGMIFGASLEGNPIDRMMGHIFDAGSAGYSALMGSFGKSGSGLLDNTDTEHLIRQANKQGLDNLQSWYLKAANVKHGRGSKLNNMVLSGLSRASANLNASNANIGNSNYNPYEMQNWNNIDNYFLQGAAGYVGRAFNDHIIDTGIKFNGTWNKEELAYRAADILVNNIDLAIDFIQKHPDLQKFIVSRYKKYLRNKRDWAKIKSDWTDVKEMWSPIVTAIKKDPELRQELKRDMVEWFLNTKAGKAALKAKNTLSAIGKIISNTAGAAKSGFDKEHFATGGIVSGVDTGEDKVDAKLKPGEMVLTEEQQRRLYDMAEYGGEAVKSSLDKLGITYNDVSSSLRENGLADTLKLYSEQIKKNKHVKTFIQKVNDIIGKTKNNLAGYGNVISLGGIRRGIGNTIGVAGAAAGGLIGGALGHPVLGAALGGGAFKKLGNLFKMKYPKLKGSLLAAGYTDAVKMRKTDLYALITNMALSKDPYEQEKGKALMETDEFQQLDTDVNVKNGWDKFVDKVKAVPKALKNGALNLKLLFHRTLKYKTLVNILDSRFGGPNGFDVTSYDKEGLYALIRSLPEKTDDDKKFKSTIMGMKEYKKLDKDVANYMTLGDHIREGVKDIPKKFVRAVRYGRLFKYRNIAKIVMNVENWDEKELLNNIKDPSSLYSHLLSWKNNEDENKSNIYNVLSKQKSFMDLKIADTRAKGKAKGLSKDEINKKVQRIKGRYKERKRFEGIIQILKNANEGRRVNFDDMEPSDLYAAATALIERGGELGEALANSGQYRLLKTAVMGKSSPNKLKGFNRIKGWLNDTFGTNFSTTSSGPDLGDPSNYSHLRKNSAFRRKLHEFETSLRKAGIRGNEARKRIHEWISRNQTFAAGGIVNGSEHGDNVGILANGGEMILNKDTQKGLFGWLKSLGGGGNRENVNLANKAFASNKNLKLSNIIKGDADQAAKKAIVSAGPFAGMVSLLSSMNKMMASTLKVLGGNDEGEIDEKNSETIAGQLGLGGGDGNNKKGGGGFNFFAAAAAAMAAMSGRSIFKKAQRIKSDGLEGLFERESSSAFNADGSEKSWIQRALDRGGDASNRAIGQSIVQKFGMTAAEKAAGKTVGGFSAVVKAAKNSAKSTASNGMDLLTKNLKGIEDTLLKFIKDPKILKKLPKTALNGVKKLPTFLKEIPKRILNFAKNGIKNTAKSASSALKSVPVAGWVMAIASVVWDVANAINDAPRFFHVAPKDVTAGMRATAGIVGGIKSLIVNLLSVTGIGAIIGVAIDMIIPTDWLVENIYKLIAGDTAKQELAEKQQKQKDVANQLGVSADKLTEAQNNSLLSKMGSGIHAAFSSKSYAQIQEEKTLKKLNKGRSEGNQISAEDYRNATGTGDIIKKIKGVKSNSSLDNYNEIASTYESALMNGDATAVEQMVKAAKEKDKDVPFLTSDTSTLTSSFRAKWEKLLNDPDIVAAGIRPVISGARRTLATQMALYSKGRGDRSAIDKAVKAAGQSAGANFWGNIDDPVTWTLKSNHLGGNALDINTSSLSSDQLALLGKTAAKYGIEWGGTWDDAHKDYPHFEDAKPTQFLARGGLVRGNLGSWGDKVRARLNPGEMVLNRVQQTALFNKIKAFEQEASMSGLSAVGKLKESPLLTNAKMDIKMIQEALNIQQAIYAEQRRHNDVAEKFFNAVLALMAGANKPVPTRIPTNDNEDISELLSGAARIATSF